MGRLWQSLILGKLNPVFAHLPVENMVYSNQQAYYDAISASSDAGQSGPFIDFMLGEILQTLRNHQGEALCEVPNKVPNKLKAEFPGISENTWSVYALLKMRKKISAAEMGEELGLSDRMIRKYLSVLKLAGIIEREGSHKTGYWKILK